MSVKYRDFEDFLAFKFAKAEPCLDDEFPDKFGEWLVDLEVEDWLKYGDEYKAIGQSSQSVDCKDGIHKCACGMFSCFIDPDAKVGIDPMDCTDESSPLSD